MRFQTKNGWALIPGPSTLSELVSSNDVQDIEFTVCRLLGRVCPGISWCAPSPPPMPSQWEWLARWESGSDFIEIAMALFDEQTQSWADRVFGQIAPLKQ